MQVFVFVTVSICFCEKKKIGVIKKMPAWPNPSLCTCRVVNLNDNGQVLLVLQFDGMADRLVDSSQTYQNGFDAKRTRNFEVYAE